MQTSISGLCCHKLQYRYILYKHSGVHGLSRQSPAAKSFDIKPHGTKKKKKSS
jgi:hypothetical protein